MRDITVIGGGLAGLVAAIESAEAGARVRLLEARSRAGGRATSTPGPYIANLGPHAFYDGPLWAWLRARKLHTPFKRPAATGVRFRWEGQLRRTPPAALVKAARLARPALPARRRAPVDVDLRTWLAAECGERTAAAVAGLAGPLTFDPDPGRLSAAFVWERVVRVLFHQPPIARYVVGGWQAVIDRLAAHAAALGVQIETGSPVASVDDAVAGGPVIVAVSPPAARRLLGDDRLRVEAPVVATVDIGVVHRRGDPYVVFDLDEAAFVDRFTTVDRTLAPDGHELVQASVGVRPGDDLSAGEARIEAVFDTAFDGWRDRVTWRRRAILRESTGALDLPGTTWRDRPAIAYSDGVWLAGDWVAAPGHLAEVSWASAVEAARHAVRSPAWEVPSPT